MRRLRHITTHLIVSTLSITLAACEEDWSDDSYEYLDDETEEHDGEEIGLAGFRVSYDSVTPPTAVDDLTDYPSENQARSTTKCLKVETEYTDAGVGEDYWTATSPYMRAAKGYYAKWWRYEYGTGWVVAKNWAYMGDGIGAGDPGNGCASGLADGYWYYVQFMPASYVNSNYVWGYDYQNGNSSIPTITTSSYYLSSGTNTISVSQFSDPAWDVINAQMAAAHAIWSKHGGESGKVYKVRVEDSGGSTGVSASAGTYEFQVDTTWDHHLAKFLIVHELGHGLYWFGTDGKFNGVADDDFYDPSPWQCSHPNNPNQSDGAPMNGKEYQSAAFHEAFAHFYSAAIWNNRTGGNCTFHHYKDYYEDFFYTGYPGDPVLDCRDGDTEWPQPYMDTYCPTPAGYGVAIDWLRALWYLYENGGSGLNVGGIIDWIESADVWDGQTGSPSTIDSLTDAADGESFESVWDTASSTNALAPEI